MINVPGIDEDAVLLQSCDIIAGGVEVLYILVNFKMFLNISRD